MAKVMVVEGSLSVRKMVERALDLKGFEVLSTSSGAEAMERIASDMPDIVVCDVVIPDMEGYRVCDFVRAHAVLSETPVLLISGFVNSVVLERAAQARSSGILRKPFTADDLAGRMEELLTARSPGGSAPPAPGISAPIAAEMLALPGLKAFLVQLAALPGVRLAALADREGFLIEKVGDLGVGTGVDVVGAMAACLAESSEGFGREMGQGALSGMVLEYEAGIVLLHDAGPSAFLAVVLGDPAAIGAVRDYVKRELPERLRPI